MRINRSTTPPFLIGGCVPEAAPKNQHNMEQRRKEGVMVELDQAPSKVKFLEVSQIFQQNPSRFKK